jgi:epoxyqueuosine reductase
MEYLERNRTLREDPGELLPGARSVIVVALNYHQSAPARPHDEPRGRVAMYAWGRDYHRLMKKRLWKLVDGLRAAVAEPFEARVCVDTAPIVERELAARAGLGWIGKNTMVLNREQGSYFFLGEVFTTLALAADEPVTDHCGSCTRCLDACPTDAFPAAYEMDASRCISYLTIELREAIDEEFKPLMGDWVYGCDVCQEVCPYNREAPATIDPALKVREPAPWPRLSELRGWTESEYAERLRGSAMKRAKLGMFVRNAGIASANQE